MALFQPKWLNNVGAENICRIHTPGIRVLEALKGNRILFCGRGFKHFYP